MHQGCLVALAWGFSCPGGLGQLGISVLFWLLIMAHFQGTKFSLVGNLSCALSAPVSFMWCSQEPCLHEAVEITKGFHPLGAGTFTRSRAVVSQKKTFVVAKGW